MNLIQDLRGFIIEWNNQFPTDRWWREKYKIPFGSPAHLEANQVDILIEYIENKAYEDRRSQLVEELAKKERYKKDGWISENEEVSDDDFENVKIEI